MITSMDAVQRDDLVRGRSAERVAQMEAERGLA